MLTELPASDKNILKEFETLKSVIVLNTPGVYHVSHTKESAP